MTLVPCRPSQGRSAMRSRGRRSWRRMRVAVLAVLSLLPVVTLTGPASATTPGVNGRIAYKGYLDADRSTGAIFTISPGGGGARQITFPSAGTTDDQPDWSPDGRLIAFRRCAPDTVCAIYTVRPDGGHLTRLSAPCNAKPPDLETRCADESEVAFLPDGRRVVFTRSTGRVREFPNGQGFIEHSDLVIRDLSGGADTVVLRSQPFAGDNTQAVASPDGRHLAFQRENSPLATPAGGIAVFVVRIDGSELRQITPWSLQAGDHPDWSPDGCRIVFRSNVDGDFLNSQLYVVHPSGRGLRQVTRVSPSTTLLSASFSPDGKRIVYARSGRGGQPDLFTMRLTGTGVQRVTRTMRWESAPDWGPRRR